MPNCLRCCTDESVYFTICTLIIFDMVTHRWYFCVDAFIFFFWLTLLAFKRVNRTRDDVAPCPVVECYLLSFWSWSEMDDVVVVGHWAAAILQTACRWRQCPGLNVSCLITRRAGGVAQSLEKERRTKRKWKKTVDGGLENEKERWRPVGDHFGEKWETASADVSHNRER